MKKKILLGKKLFLKKETVGELSSAESNNVVGGFGASTPSAGCFVPAPQTGTAATCYPPNVGGPGSGSLCVGGCVVIGTSKGASCYNYCAGQFG